MSTASFHVKVYISTRNTLRKRIHLSYLLVIIAVKSLILKKIAMREECAVACEKFCKIFPMHFDRPLTRKMHSLSLVLPWHVRQRGLYYEFLCLEQAGERAHCRLNEAERVYANVQPQENRYFLMMKYLKNRDRSDLSVVQPVPCKKNKSLL